MQRRRDAAKGWQEQNAIKKTEFDETKAQFQTTGWYVHLKRKGFQISVVVRTQIYQPRYDGFDPEIIKWKEGCE